MPQLSWLCSLAPSSGTPALGMLAPPVSLITCYLSEEDVVVNAFMCGKAPRDGLITTD